MLKYNFPLFPVLVSMGGKGDTPATRPGLARRGGVGWAGQGGVRYLCLLYTLLGGVCSLNSVSVFRASFYLPGGNNCQHPDKCTETSRPSVGRLLLGFCRLFFLT